MALQAKEEGARGSTPSQSHVPFRNSMLTSVLRGSLGGNCKSVFIATLNPEIEFLDESISTCRFAQRCSQVMRGELKILRQEMSVPAEKILLWAIGL